MNNEDFDDDEEVDNIEKLLFCSICHKNTFDIITDHYKKNCVLKEILKSTDYSELIKKCNCKINNEEIHSHKFCVLLKILFKYETRCEKCKTDYNIKITKKLDRKKFLTSIIFYLIIYIIHLFFFLFCVFLLFIHDILKEFMKSNKIISYRHLFIFFGIIIFFINCFFLYFSVIKNIKQFKINVYNYLIDILDAEEDDKNKTKTIPLLNEFQEWAHSQSLKDLIYDVNNKFFFNRIYSSYINEVNGIIDKNNVEFKNNMDNINIISVDSNENKYLDNLQSNLNLFSNNNLFNNNPKFLQINNLFNKQNEEINFSSLQSSKLNNENNENENSNNNIIIHNNNSNNFIR